MRNQAIFFLYDSRLSSPEECKCKHSSEEPIMVKDTSQNKPSSHKEGFRTHNRAHGLVAVGVALCAPSYNSTCWETLHSEGMGRVNLCGGC
ncbi:hypothetical protein TNIN_382751 [Trichonephila inaurata madagascariensis]|uniref:Uncharacterized protein n=1 Tax=Trichonephila inaurata madagascariensis TaxID=2747483 RepID=A0A8X7C504_9ARAC|nr:hypothetical protein TNIN_382751 [Trichonephila inaurata madagascariensis]